MNFTRPINFEKKYSQRTLIKMPVNSDQKFSFDHYVILKTYVLSWLWKLISIWKLCSVNHLKIVIRVLFDLLWFVNFLFIFSSQRICFTPGLKMRRGNTSWSGLCNIPIHTSWTSNAQDATRSQLFSVMHKPLFCA